MEIEAEEGFASYEAFMEIGGIRKSVIGAEKYPDFYTFSDFH